MAAKRSAEDMALDSLPGDEWAPPGTVATRLQHWRVGGSEGCKLCKAGKGGTEVVEFSRHTDVPATSMDEVLEVLRAGHFRYIHPRYVRNRVIQPNQWLLACIVPGTIISWWTKDPCALAAAFRTYPDLFARFAHHFSFTLHEPCAVTEGLVRHSLADRLAAAAELAAHGPVLVHACDPIVWWRDGEGRLLTNEPLSDALGRGLVRMGVKRVHTSFAQSSGAWRHIYGAFSAAGLTLIDPPLADKVEWAKEVMLPWLERHGLIAQACTSDVVRAELKTSLFQKGVCVSYGALRAAARKAGIPFTLKYKRKGAATGRAECGCQHTRDVGCGRTPCGHACRYCFAHPASRGAPPPIRDIEDMVPREGEGV
jgi:hypothetical protein